MDSCFCLFKVRHGIVQTVEHHGGCCGKCDAQTCRCDLSYKDLTVCIFLKSADFLCTVRNTATHRRIANLFSFQQFLNAVQFWDKPCQNDQLFFFCKHGVQNIGQSIQFCCADSIAISLVIGEVTACDLRQTKHFCQYIYCRNFRTCKLRKAFFFQLLV